MSCSHQNDIFERCCQDCGMFVQNEEMVRGWTSQNSTRHFTETEETQLVRELLSLNFHYSTITHALKSISQVESKKRTTLKGRRKRSLIFACLFAKLKGDPEKMRIVLGLDREECQKGVELYERELGSIYFPWRSFVAEKLSQLKLKHKREQVEQMMISKTSRKTFAQQAKDCIKQCEKDVSYAEIDAIFIQK